MLTADQKSTLLAQMQARHDESLTGWASWRKRAEKAEQYVHNKQWDQAVVEVLAAAGRPALALNKILHLVNYLSGVERQNKRDLLAIARKGGEEAVARVLTYLVKHAHDLSHAGFEQSHVFLTSLVCAKAWVQLDHDFTRDPFSGDLLTTARHPFDVLEDPNTRTYDLADAGWVELGSWQDKRAVAMQYPDAYLADGDSQLISDSQSDPMKELWSYLSQAAYGPSIGSDDSVSNWSGEYSDPGKRRHRVRKTWWRQPVKRTVVIDRRTQDRRLLDPAKDRDAISRAKLAAAAYPQAIAIKEDHAVRLIHCTTWMSGVLLDHQEDVMGGLDFFPMFRLTPYWHEDYLIGMVEALIDPQDEINKRRSQAMHHLNRSANSGYMVADGSNAMEVAKLEQMGSKPGVVIDLKKLGGHVEQINPAQLSQGHMQLAEQATRELREISAINTANVGIEAGAKESGVLNEQRNRQGLTANEIVFDNFDRFLELVGIGTLEMIRTQQVYTLDEIVRIVDKEDLFDPQHLARAWAEITQQAPPPSLDPVELVGIDDQTRALAELLAKQDMDAYRGQFEPEVRARAMQMMMDQLRNWGTGRYGIVVSEAAQTPTAKLATAATLFRLAEKNPGLIPPDILIKHSALPEAVREEILAGIQRNQQQAQPPQPQAMVAA